MNAQPTIIDADGHIVEPPALWQEYVELAFRDRIPQVVKDDEGVERLKVEGPHPAPQPDDDCRHVYPRRPESARACPSAVLGGSAAGQL